MISDIIDCWNQICLNDTRTSPEELGGYDMARITVEDCLKKVSNRFDLVVLASRRAKQLFEGAKPLIDSDNREVVLALREVAAGRVRKSEKSLQIT